MQTYEKKNILSKTKSSNRTRITTINATNSKENTISPSLLGKWRDQVMDNPDQVFTKQADLEQAKKIRKYKHVMHIGSLIV
ncbi:MAG: hypothetical protein ACI83D_000298 [Planctomycetota bacterium]|jgi:hypothetical protein